MRNLINILAFILLTCFVLVFPIFFALALASMMIVPLTWAYAQVMGQSYSFTIDQSNMLYRLNIFGQWSLLIGGSVLLFSLLLL